MRRRLAVFAFAFAVMLDVGIVGACGARTGLPDLEVENGAGAAPAVDAGHDADADADAPFDVVSEDVADVVEEGLPACDPEALYVYLVTEETVLYRYDPAAGSFVSVGLLDCPSGTTPFSMGVNRKGAAFVVYADGELFLVDVQDASCQQTDFQVGQSGFVTFGMGYAIDDDLMGETLYVDEINFQLPPKGLARILVPSLELEFIGPFSQTWGTSMELTSSDDGKLYGYMLDGSGSGGHLLEIDKHTAQVVAETPLPVGESASALAFAYWGGDFYIFTSPGAGTGTTVTRYRPSDGSVVVVATLSETVVGAGVSTCKVAPAP